MQRSCRLDGDAIGNEHRDFARSHAAVARISRQRELWGLRDLAAAVGPLGPQCARQRRRSSLGRISGLGRLVGFGKRARRDLRRRRCDRNSARWTDGVLVPELTRLERVVRRLRSEILHVRSVPRQRIIGTSRSCRPARGHPRSYLYHRRRYAGFPPDFFARMFVWSQAGGSRKQRNMQTPRVWMRCYPVP